MTATLLTGVQGPYNGPASKWVHKNVTFADFAAGYGSEDLFSLPAGALVLEIIVLITTAFSASTTFTLGDSTTADRFMDTTLAAPTVEGSKSTKQDAQSGSGGHEYAAADIIQMALAGATPAAGVVDFWLNYLPSEDFMLD